MKPTAVILMGGKALRLDGINKSNISIQGISCFERITACIQPHIDEIALCIADQTQHDAKHIPYKMIYDESTPVELKGLPAALLGIIKWTEANRIQHVITTSADTPFLPLDYVNGLMKAYACSANPDAPVVSVSDKRIHTLHALWPAPALMKLRRLILDRNVYSLNKAHVFLNSTHCLFDAQPYDPFLNINTAVDLKTAVKISKTYAL